MLRLPAVRLLGLRFLRPRIPFSTRFFAPSSERVPSERGLLEEIRGSPAPRFVNGDDRASQVPGGPVPTCRALRPRRTAVLFVPFEGLRWCLPPIQKCRLREQCTFEAQSHGLQTPCVRFTLWVAPDRATLGSGCRHAWPVGTYTRWVPTRSFCVLHVSSFQVLPGALNSYHFLILFSESCRWYK